MKSPTESLALVNVGPFGSPFHVALWKSLPSLGAPPMVALVWEVTMTPYHPQPVSYLSCLALWAASRRAQINSQPRGLSWGLCGGRTELSGPGKSIPRESADQLHPGSPGRLLGSEILFLNVPEELSLQASMHRARCWGHRDDQEDGYPALWTLTVRGWHREHTCSREPSGIPLENKERPWMYAFC